MANMNEAHPNFRPTYPASEICKLYPPIGYSTTIIHQIDETSLTSTMIQFLKKFEPFKEYANEVKDAKNKEKELLTQNLLKIIDIPKIETVYEMNIEHNNIIIGDNNESYKLTEYYGDNDENEVQIINVFEYRSNHSDFLVHSPEKEEVKPKRKNGPIIRKSLEEINEEHEMAFEKSTAYKIKDFGEFSISGVAKNV